MVIVTLFEWRGIELHTIADQRTDSVWWQSPAQVHSRVFRFGADIVLFFRKFVIVRDAEMDKWDKVYSSLKWKKPLIENSIIVKYADPLDTDTISTI